MLLPYMCRQQIFPRNPIYMQHVDITEHALLRNYVNTCATKGVTFVQNDRCQSMIALVQLAENSDRL